MKAERDQATGRFLKASVDETKQGIKSAVTQRLRRDPVADAVRGLRIDLYVIAAMVIIANVFFKLG